MSFSKYKNIFEGLINRAQRTSNELYQHLCESDDISRPNILNDLPQIINVQPLTPVPNIEDTENTDNTDINTINEELDLKMQQDGRLLREIFSTEVSEAQIYDLLQKYNTVELVINAYYEREITENQECG
jgi:hypothetical protein